MLADSTISARAVVRHARCRLRDGIRNAACRGRHRRFLVLRDSQHQPSYNDHFLDHLARHRPAARALFELRRPGARVRDWSRYALFLPWLQDPLRERFPLLHAEARAHERACTAAGVPVSSPVDSLSRAIKSVALPVIGSLGVRTARTMPAPDGPALRQAAVALGFPFLVRDDWEHGGVMRLVRSEADLHGALDGIAVPIAMEFIETRSPDGLYRKYRYVLMGDVGLPRHLIIARPWLVRARDRVRTEAALAEEIAYLEAGDPNHDVLRRAQRALGLDVVAFDYGYDPDGSLVVWEPNPFVNLWQGFNRAPYYDYQAPFLGRIYDALLAYYVGRSTLGADERARVLEDAA